LLGSVRKGVSVFVWTSAEDLFQESSGLADSLGLYSLAIRANSQTVLAGNGTVTYTDPDLCRTGLAQRMELARSQCGQIKSTSWRLAMFASATEALKWSRRTNTQLRICQMTCLGKFSPEEHVRRVVRNLRRFDRSGSYGSALVGFFVATLLAVVLMTRLGPYRFRPG